MPRLAHHSSSCTKNAPPVRPAERTGGALTLRRQLAVSSASADHVEDVLLHPVGVGLVFDELQLLSVLVGAAEQALARAKQQRVDEQVVAVDQARVGQGVVERGAA